MKKIVLFCVMFFMIQPIFIYANSDEGRVSFIVKSSSTSLFQTELTIESDSFLQSIINTTPIHKVTEVPLSTSYILVEDEGMIRSFSMDENGMFYDIQRKEKIIFQMETTEKIKGYFKTLQAHHFGQIVEWEVAEELLPRYSEFKITDLETGLSFNVQRRAGSNHADVQPLTKEDTTIMKKIYDGKWSWKRRAVLIHLNDQKIAASIHGMPHGGGALANGFPGHFCIHYKGSTTHTTKTPELSHQVMVNKAGGVLSSYVSQLPAEDIVTLFFVAINQNDMDLFHLIYRSEMEENLHGEIINNNESIRIITKNVPTINEALVYEVPISYKVKQKGDGEINDVFIFRVVRDSPSSPWRLDNLPFKKWEVNNE